MAGPWEEFQQKSAAEAAPAGAGPWDDFRQAASAAPVASGPSDFDQHINAASQKYGLPVPLLRAQIQAESSFNPNARSPVGAAGLMQLMPGTAKELGVTDPFDPAQNIDAGARYMRRMLDASKGSIDEALARYNWGPGNVDRKGMANMPKETRDYIAKINKGGAFNGVGRNAPAQRAALAGGPEPSFLADMKKLGRGIGDVGRKGEQIVSQLLPDQFEQAMRDTVIMERPKGLEGLGPSVQGPRTSEEIVDEEREYQKWREGRGDTGTDWWRLGGNLISPTSLVLGKSMHLPAGVSAGKGILQAIGTGAVEGAAHPTYGKSEDFWTDTAKQAGLGGLFGGAGYAAMRGLTTAGGKIAGAIKGKYKDDAGQLLATSKEFDIPVTATDLRANKVASGSEAFLERVPVIGLDRKEQRDAAQRAAERITGKLQEDMKALPFQSTARLQQLASSGGKNAASAQRLLEQAAAAGDDWQKVIQVSGNMKAFRMKLGADELFDEVRKLAGNQPVPLNTTAKALETVGRQIDDAIIPDQTSQRLVQSIVTRLDNPDVPVTYGALQQMRSDLGAMIEDAYRGADAVTGSRTASHLSALRNAVTRDMDEFAKATPALKQAWTRANSFYANNVAPYKAKDLAKALTDVDADDIYKSFLNQGPNQSARFYKALDEKGRAAVRYGMVANALDKAYDPQKNTFVPTAFARAMKASQDAQGVYLKGADKAQVQGFTNLMSHMERASLPLSSSGLLGSSMLVGTGFGVGVAPGATLAGMGAYTAFAKFLFTSRPGLRLLTAANLARPGSNAAGKVAAEATNAFSHWMAKQGPESQATILGGVLGGRAAEGEPVEQQP